MQGVGGKSVVYINTEALVLQSRSWSSTETYDVLGRFIQWLGSYLLEHRHLPMTTGANSVLY